MSLVTLAFFAASVVCVFVIAAVVIGREARRLDAVAPRAVYELEDAVAFVAARIPAGSQARLTFDEVRLLLVTHMRWLHARGLQPVSAHVPHGRAWARMSDHLPLIAELAL